MARTGFHRMMKHRCTVQAPSAGAVDTFGRGAQTYSDVAINVACLLQQKKLGRVPGMDAVPVMLADVLYLPLGDVTIHEGYKIKDVVVAGTSTYVRTDRDGNQVEFIVQSVDDAAGQRHHYQIGLKAVV